MPVEIIKKNILILESKEIHYEFTYLRALPTPEEIKQQYPLSAKLAAIKADRDKSRSKILSAKKMTDFLLIIGPCP